MSIDPSIALQVQPAQIQNPLAAYAQISAIQDAQSRNRLLDLTLQDKQREIGQANALNDAYAKNLNPDGTVNSQGLLGAVAQSGYGSAIPGIQKSLSDAATAKLAQQKSQIEVGLQRFGALAQVLSGVKDQPSYTAAIQHAAQAFGPEAVANVPAQYDPQFVQSKMNEALTVQQQLEQHNKLIDQQLAASQFGETQRHNQATEGTAAGNLSVAQGNALETARHNAATETQSRVPAGYRANADGSLSAIPGGPADKGANLNEGQANAVAFGARALDAQNTLRQLEAGGTTNGGRIAAGLDSVPVIGGTLGGLARSTGGWGLGIGNLSKNYGVAPDDQQQSYDQAKRNFVSAVLRKESGAAISESEFANEDKKYFPQAGDSAATIEQKARARDLAIEGLKAQAGPGAQLINGIIDNANRDYGSQPKPSAPQDQPAQQTQSQAALATLSDEQRLALAQQRAARDPAFAARLRAMGH